MRERDYAKEDLDHVDYGRLCAAGRNMGNWGADSVVARYNYYRRKGYNSADSLVFTFSWAHNATEQKKRRLDHDTGAIDPASVGTRWA